MGKIVRTPTRAKGGITDAEREKMAEVVKDWTAVAMRTAPVDPAEATGAISALYKAVDLEPPRVVVCPSPLVMAFAYGASAAIWHTRKEDGATYGATDDATRAATDDATYGATRAATRAATYGATRAATDDATRAATDDATDDATRAATYGATYDATYGATYGATYDATYDATYGAAAACLRLAGPLGLRCAALWHRPHQGGAYWAGQLAFVAATRDVLGLRLPEHKKYAAWEQAGRAAPFRIVHAKFCMVSDFPEVLEVDEENRPHCETGPSHKWRDGWALYHWHGVRVPAHWIENRKTLDPAEVLACEDVEQRAAGVQIVGLPRVVDKLNRKIIDGDPETDMGALIELTLPGLDRPGRFLQAVCPRNGEIIEDVPYESDIDGKPITTALAAQAWRTGEPVSEYQHPPIRT